MIKSEKNKINQRSPSPQHFRFERGSKQREGENNVMEKGQGRLLPGGSRHEASVCAGNTTVLGLKKAQLACVCQAQEAGPQSRFAMGSES